MRALFEQYGKEIENRMSLKILGMILYGDPDARSCPRCEQVGYEDSCIVCAGNGVVHERDGSLEMRPIPAGQPAYSGLRSNRITSPSLDL